LGGRVALVVDPATGAVTRMKIDALLTRVAKLPLFSVASVTPLKFSRT
jgi:hypothetical protein